jgi:hypothetical protein
MLKLIDPLSEDIKKNELVQVNKVIETFWGWRRDKKKKRISNVFI